MLLLLYNELWASLDNAKSIGGHVEEVKEFRVQTAIKSIKSYRLNLTKLDNPQNFDARPEVDLTVTSLLQ